METNTPLDEIQEYGIVFVSLEGSLCFDMHLFCSKILKGSQVLAEEISQASVQGSPGSDPNRCFQLSLALQPENSL